MAGSITSLSALGYLPRWLCSERSGLPTTDALGTALAIAAVIFFGFYLWRRRNYLLLGLANGNSLFFLKNNPSGEQLLAFLKEMEEARKRYFHREYFRIIDPDTPQRELNRFEWLLKEGIISKPELEDMKAELQNAYGNTATDA